MESLKKYIIRGTTLLPSIEGMESNKVILATSCGLISGDILKPTNELSSSNILGTTIEALKSTYLEDNQLSPDYVADGNDGYIILKDVTIQNGTTNIFLPILCVFYDQIIGISVGTIE